MNLEHYKKEFSEKALMNGYSDENIKKCLDYAEPLIKAGLPIIYNLSHFSSLVGYKKNYLTRAVFFTKYFYKKYEIKKSNGGTREICEPLPSLKDIQIWILTNILYKVPISRFAKAYVKKHTLKNNLTLHRNQAIVVSLDIEEFFPSIRKDGVENIFNALGYSGLLSNLFGKLCCLENSLPQGAPTSPCLSNIYLSQFDEIIGGYCLDNEIRYSRYADDMTFSGTAIDIEKLLELVRAQLNQLGLHLNSRKTKIMRSDQRQIVTGIVVNDKIQVPRLKRRQIRQEVYYIKTRGLKDHRQFTGNNMRNHILHLLGQVNFVLQINPSDKEFIEYRKFLKTISDNSA